MNEATVPNVGENWISDTKVKGFGLRLYNSRSGPIKRFCIRTTDFNGKSVRKTFDEWSARHEHYKKWQRNNWVGGEQETFNWDTPVGNYANAAREWASNEIRLLKRLSTISSEDQQRNLHSVSKLRNATLEQCVQALLSNYRRMKLSTPYVDKLDKLFSQSLDQELREKRMKEISKSDALLIHQSINALPGNRRTMMPFLGRVFDVYQGLAGGKNEFAIAKDLLRRLPNGDSNKFEIDDSNIALVKEVISLLESEQKYWQQARCLRLYFGTHAPLSQLMAIRRDQIFEVSSGRSGKKWLRWEYKPSRFGYEQFPYEENNLISEILELGKVTHSDSPYLFPSTFSRKVGHIRSVDHVWLNTLNEAGLKFATPRKLRMAIQELGAWRVLPEKLQQFQVLEFNQ